MKVRPFPFVVLAVTLAACAHGASRAPASLPGGGTVEGRLVAQRSDGSHRVAEAGQRVGVFTRAVPPGPIMVDPLDPIATAVTSNDGSFRFQGLGPGRFFITVAAQGRAVEGTWVTVTADRGASVALVECTDCPVPL